MGQWVFRIRVMHAPRQLSRRWLDKYREFKPALLFYRLTGWSACCAEGGRSELSSVELRATLWPHDLPRPSHISYSFLHQEQAGDECANI